MNIFTQKLKEVLTSVIPVTIIVLILNFTLSPLATPLVIRFVLGAALIILGLTFFLIGVDLGVTPLGSLLGSTITKSNKLWLLVLSGLVLGFFISIAEPGLLVLANQVASVTLGQISSSSILVVVSIGLAILITFGFIRVVYNIPLYKTLTVIYLIILF